MHYKFSIFDEDYTILQGKTDESKEFIASLGYPPGVRFVPIPIYTNDDDFIKTGKVKVKRITGDISIRAGEVWESENVKHVKIGTEYDDDIQLNSEIEKIRVEITKITIR